MLIKPTRFIVQRVNDNGANAGIFCHEHTTPDRVLEQRRAKLQALCLYVNRQPRQYQYRDRVWHILPNRSNRVLMRYSTSCESVITNNLELVVCNNKRSARAAGLVPQSPTF